MVRAVLPFYTSPDCEQKPGSGRCLSKHHGTCHLGMAQRAGVDQLADHKPTDWHHWQSDPESHAPNAGLGWGNLEGKRSREKRTIRFGHNKFCLPAPGDGHIELSCLEERAGGIVPGHLGFEQWGCAVGRNEGKSCYCAGNRCELLGVLNK